MKRLHFGNDHVTSYTHLIPNLRNQNYGLNMTKKGYV